MRHRVFPLLIVVPITLLPAIALAAETPAKKVLSAAPKSGWYVSGKGGPAFAALHDVHASQSGNEVRNTSGSNLVGAFGMAAGYEWMYRYHVPLRTELEFINRTEVTYDTGPLFNTGTSGALASTVQNVTTMAKAYWHFPVDSDKWWPFVSVGLGWSHNTVKSQYTPSGGVTSKFKTASNDLAWSAGIGASFKLGPDMMNDIELRYVDLGAADWGLPTAQNIKASGFRGFSSVDLMFSLRYVF